jgi:hypothetical protein
MVGAIRAALQQCCAQLWLSGAGGSPYCCLLFVGFIKITPDMLMWFWHLGKEDSSNDVDKMVGAVKAAIQQCCAQLKVSGPN